MFWEILLGVAGAAAYYVLRYDRTGALSLAGYLKAEWVALVKGLIGFFLLWGAWSALNKFAFMPYAVPEMSPATALVVGFAAKKAVDYTIMRLANAGGKDG